MSICCIVGARPNFIKMAPIVSELKRRNMPRKLVHTGQHYDAAMSRTFFEELQMPAPDVYLGVGSGSHAQQTGKVMMAIEDCLLPDTEVAIVAGDVNSTVAAAMAAAKLQIPVVHVEAGLRSFDRAMPEELNRIVTDHISDLLCTTEESGNRNLRSEGIREDKIRFVGNCMVDSLRLHEREAASRRPWDVYGLEAGRYAILTLHRPSNVDDEDSLRSLLAMVSRIAERIPVVFPMHPRTRQEIARLEIRLPSSLQLLDPLPYLSFLGLMARAKFVLTDSGGVQEETTALGIPCLTLRSNTERPSTVDLGTNELVGNDLGKVEWIVDRICQGNWKTGRIPPLWDGHAAGRVVDAVESLLDKRFSSTPTVMMAPSDKRGRKRKATTAEPYAA